MKILFILNEPPYGNERLYNGLRLAGALARPVFDSERAVPIGAPQGFHVRAGADSLGRDSGRRLFAAE